MPKRTNPRSEAAKRGWETRRSKQADPARIAFANAPPSVFFRDGAQRLGVNDRHSAKQLLAAINEWAAIAVNAIADEGMSLRPYVAVRRIQPNGVIREERLDDHALSILLRNPSPDFPIATVLRLLFSWIAQVGDGYLLKITNGLGLPARLHPLNPKDMELIPGATGIETYLYRSPHTGIEHRYSPHEIIRIYKPDPNNQYLALGNLGPQQVSYNASLFAAQTVEEFFRNDAKPHSVLQFDINAKPMSDEALRRLYVEWAQEYNRRGGNRSGLPATLPPGATLHDFPIWSGKDWVPILEHFRDKLLAAYGVPPSVVGLTEHTNRANADTNRFVFETTTIKPVADLIADALTRHLAQDFDARLVVRFDDFITEDRDFKLKKQQAHLSQFVRTINEVRVEEGLDPVPWGQVPVAQMQDVALDPNREPESATPNADPPRDAEESEEDEE